MMRLVVRTEGIGGLYRGITLTLWSIMPRVYTTKRYATKCPFKARAQAGHCCRHDAAGGAH